MRKGRMLHRMNYLTAPWLAGLWCQIHTIMDLFDSETV